MKQRLAMRREFNQDFSLIFITVLTANGAAFDKAVQESDRAVVAETKLLRKRSNCGTGTRRQTLDGQKDLVLLRLNSLGAGRFFAEAQKLPYPVTELGKAPKAEF